MFKFSRLFTTFKKLQSDLLNNLKLDFINIDQNIDALIQLESIFD